MDERQTVLASRSTSTSNCNNSLVFAVNGQRFELQSIHPSTTLLEFLRTRTRFKSVKLSCGEGGCGACVVLLSKYDPVREKVENYSVSSCLTLLCSINGCSITTTEGLGNSKDGFHSIHQRFAGFHASQCGFCTPGICMSLYSALINAEESCRPKPSAGFSKLTVAEAERAISGHLCRCTGYRPIADACKSFAADVDMEDLGISSFWRSGETKQVRCLPSYDPDDQPCSFPEFLKDVCRSKMVLDSCKYSWFSPASLEELQRLLSSNVVENTSKIKLVVGNTGTGYYKELTQYDKYIDLRYIPEISRIKIDQTGIEVGAAVTISKLISIMKEEDAGTLNSDEKQVFMKVADHMEKIASRSIRNTASLGGNLVMAQRNCFPSDIATILLAVGSTVHVMTGQKHENITLEEFLAWPPLDSKSVVLSIQFPFLKPLKNGKLNNISPGLLFETYRASPRPLGNALPYLNAAFLIDLSCLENGVLVNDVHLAFGAYGNKHAIRSREVEEYLTGKILSARVLYEAINLLKESFIIDDGNPLSAYRSSLAIGFLFEFISSCINDGSEISGRLFDRINETLPKDDSSGNSDSCFNQKSNSTLLSSAKQVVESSQEYHPVGEPMIKSGAAIQASGEAVYVDDIPSPPGCLHGAFIYSTEPLAWVRGISLMPDSLEGIKAVLSFQDIPEGGDNVGSKTMFGFEPLFADELTRCAGERIAFVVADTQKYADMAASTVMVDYSTDNLDPPILTVEDAVERSSFFDVPPFLYPKQVGDFSKGMAEADHKIMLSKLELGSQYYFYMETQCALAVPDEDNCMVVYSSIQCPEFAHSVIARCLGVPENNVRVVTRRVGGGFGGKAIKAMPVAAACALAAFKLQQPVRIYLNRKTDMIMAGGRHPMKIVYSVGFKSNGKITALHLDILINAGITADISPIIPLNMMNALQKYNWGALSFDIKVCKTNHSSKSAMRGPGEVQGSYITEAIIEDVAAMLQMEVDSVRTMNLHTPESLNLFYGISADESIDYTLPTIWDKLAGSSNLVQRTKHIKEFNMRNRWQKRGISRTPIVIQVTQRPTPGKVSILWDGSVVVEVGGIELGQGLWTKVKQMAAYALSLIDCEGTKGILDKVRVIQADTLSLVQGGFTAGSTTSESSCEAVRLCCNILVERLSPLKKELQAKMGSINWDTLILQAHYQSVNLAASSYFVPDPGSMRYLNYGAAVSEVEVNVLTGETRILRSDIVYDCGQSMNPAVDLGQIEGAFVQGIGFFMLEEYLTNTHGLVVADGTWTYKIPTIDTIPNQFNVEVLNSGRNQKRVLSSKASGEPPLFLAVSVHCATRAAIKGAREQLRSWGGVDKPEEAFKLDVPATMPVVKRLCGLDTVERYLESLLTH